MGRDPVGNLRVQGELASKIERPAPPGELGRREALEQQVVGQRRAARSDRAVVQGQRQRGRTEQLTNPWCRTHEVAQHNDVVLPQPVVARRSVQSRQGLLTR